jgi:hypothetical protein
VQLLARGLAQRMSCGERKMPWGAMQCAAARGTRLHVGQLRVRTHDANDGGHVVALASGGKLPYRLVRNARHSRSWR